MPPLVSVLESVALGLMNQSLAVRILVMGLILLVGLVAAKLSGRAVTYLWYLAGGREQVDRIKRRRSPAGRATEYVVTVATLVVAMVYINAAAASQILANIAAEIPNVVTAFLILVLGVILVNGLISVSRAVINSFGVRELPSLVGMSPRILDGFLTGAKLLLYLVVLELVVIHLGASPDLINTTITAASYGLVALFIVLGFFGFKDLLQNYAAGIYLRSSDLLRPGKKVRIGEEAGKIRDISAFGTVITTDTGYFLLAPNKELMNTDLLFKRVKANVEALEEVSNYFVAEQSMYSGPAAVEMALAMAGYDVGQEEIAEAAEVDAGSVESLMDAIQDHTDGEVQTAFIDHTHITNLADEFKVWFNDGALIVPWFAKPVLFPHTEQADYYALSVGVEGDEVLLVDPGADATTGRVYYVEGDELQAAMAEYEDDIRGYLVIAPPGTTAQWRVEHDLVYADRRFYEDLSKTLEVRLRRILREGRIREEVMPATVQEFLDKWGDQHERHAWYASDTGDMDEPTDSK